MAVRSGGEYLAGLRDQRQVLLEDRVITDVLAEPGFRNTARTFAEFYDFQKLPEMREVMTYETEDGDRAGMAFIKPRSKEDLRRRAAAFAAWAEVTCGLMGRAPDYMNACMMGLGAAAVHWGRNDRRYGENARSIYLDARRRDLCMTHTWVQPFVDRFKKPSEQATTLRVVRETADGPVVSGARAVGTLAPLSDANLVILGTGRAQLTEEEGEFAIAFTQPVDMPGLRWVCRDPYDQERPFFDAPLAGRVDEIDAIAIFDECLIPWENLIIYKDVEIFNKQVEYIRLMDTLAHHVLMKNIAKTRFMLGLAHLIAESSQINNFINVQERLGDFVVYLATLESLAIAAVEGAVQDPHNGLWYPNPTTMWVSLRLFPEYYVNMVNHLMQLGGSGYMNQPQERMLERYGEAFEQYFRGANTGARQKVGLFRMAWDLIGSGWAGRQELYERFFFGDMQLMKVRHYLSMDKSEAVAMVQRLLTGAAMPERPFPIPEKFGGPKVESATAESSAVP
jgi:4-hydroxyphenylacetate 3-monooxygenase